MTSSRSTTKPRRGPKTRLNSKYKSIEEHQRIKIIYLARVHGVPMHDIERELAIQYNSIRNILKIFDQTGLTEKRTFKRKGAGDHLQGEADSDDTSSLPSYVPAAALKQELESLRKVASLTASADHADPSLANNPASGIELSSTLMTRSSPLGAQDVREQPRSGPEYLIEAPREVEGEKNKTGKNYNKNSSLPSTATLDPTQAYLKLSCFPSLDAPIQTGTDSSSNSRERLQLLPGGSNEGPLKHLRLSPPELAQFRQCTAYINTFPGSLSYLNNYNDPAKRKTIVGQYERAQQSRAARNMKTLPAISHGSEF